jgi:hypothetical protein
MSTAAARSWPLLAALASACAPEPVSYAALDAPLDRPPVLVGLVADLTGPAGEDGRALARGLRAAFDQHAEGALPELRLVAYDDRGRGAGLEAAARRFERQHGVLIAVAAPPPERGAALARAAVRTIVVCAGCPSEGAPREASFALAAQGGDPELAGRAVGRWLASAIGSTSSLHPRDLAAAMRRAAPGAGGAPSEGAEPADPTVFRPPAPAAR